MSLYTKQRNAELFKSPLTDESINELIEINMKLVYYRLNAWNLVGDDDALGYGLDGLHTAVLNFDSTTGYAFSTYASVCIFNKIGSQIKKRTTKKGSTMFGCSMLNDKNDHPAFIDYSGVDMEHHALQSDKVRALAAQFDETYNELPNANQKRIVKTWKDSDFTMGQVTIAVATNNSQAQVSRVLRRFREKLKIKLEETECYR